MDTKELVEKLKLTDEEILQLYMENIKKGKRTTEDDKLDAQLKKALFTYPLALIDREKGFPDIEGVFADVANLPKEKHKNVIGDKWRFIKAVQESIANYLPVIPLEEAFKEVIQ